jgi:hypothetical protein
MSIDKDSESVVFAQIDANLDTNPKIRKAGSFGRQVFEFVLRRNSLRGSKGSVPIAFVDPDYLADILMIARDAAVTGVTKAVTANLILIDDVEGVVRIVGWHESWGRRAKEGKDRTREWRERKSLKSPSAVTAGDDGDVAPSQVTTSDESDVLDQKRSDQILDKHTRARERHPAAGGVARSVWNYGAQVRAELAAANVDVAAWPLMPGTEHAGWIALLDRVGERLVGADVAKAEQVCRNRIDVAAAKARGEGDGNWFASTSLFTRKSFDAFAELDPKQFVRKPARKRSGTEAIGAAPPRMDHPDGDRLIPISELT